MNFDEETIWECVLCEKDCKGFGNNPHPLKCNNTMDRCCDYCNIKFVIPIRILQSKNKKIKWNNQMGKT